MNKYQQTYYASNVLILFDADSIEQPRNAFEGLQQKVKLKLSKKQ